MSNYVENEDLYEVLIQYNKEMKVLEDSGSDELPDIPEAFALAMIAISNGLGKRPNFSGYTYLDEMKADAIENCLKAIRGFNTEKYDKPFAYFTQISWWAFLRRIEAEKKHSYIKHKSLEIFATTAELNGDISSVPLYTGQNEDLVKHFEKKIKKKVKKIPVHKVAANTVERFLD